MTAAALSLHEKWMQEAIRLAEQGRYTAAPNPVVGAIIIKNDRKLAQGYHQRAGEAHAEIIALRALTSLEAAQGADLYVTLEPCAHHGRTPPCIEAIIKAKITRVIIGALDPNPLVNGQGIAALQAAGIEVIGPVLEKEALALNPGFFKRMQTGLPFVRAKSAASMDGRISAPNGESKWITGPQAREDGHRLRARCQAIVTGTGTLLEDDPYLTVRLPEWDEDCQPWRLVLDPKGKAHPGLHFFASPGRATAIVGPEVHSTAPHHIIMPLDTNQRIHLLEFLKFLGQQAINEVLIEAGPTLIGAFLGEGLVDRWHVYLAPKVLSERGQPLCIVPKIEKISQHLHFSIDSHQQIGDDLRIDLIPTL